MMKTSVILCSVSLALLAAPLAAWADANPNFNEDAKPILRSQPGLVEYVRSHFEVKSTGKAKYPGDDDSRPVPPYIFRARPLGSNGPFNIHLLIQPGPPGHILCVVPPSGQPTPQPGAQPQQPQQPETEPFGPAQQPSTAQEPQPQQPTPYQPQEAQQPYQSPALSQGEVKPLPPETASQPAPTPAPAPQQPAPSSPSEPTSDTPSGPIMPSSSGTATNPQPTLAPPPDPAPSNQ